MVGPVLNGNNNDANKKAPGEPVLEAL
ncbi:protein of unknown function [Agrobacterium pusense]|uniref:Uncharacterized protein n=1 Tax=Agrobacterium pusense TaxID=648995 RepID=U4PS48_9HYPH|nr:protein of unknown function [Agrobacterium pusense]